MTERQESVASDTVTDANSDSPSSPLSGQLAHTAAAALAASAPPPPDSSTSGRNVTQIRKSLCSGEFRLQGWQKADDRDDELEIGTVTSDDGQTIEVVVRDIDESQAWSYPKFRKSEIACELNTLVNFSCWIPVCAERIITVEDVDRRVWLEERQGVNLDYVLNKRVDETFHNDEDESILRAVQNDPPLLSQIEEVFAERLMNGDNDVHLGNILYADGQLYNIDHAFSFGDRLNLSWSQSSLYGLTKVVRTIFAGKPVSEALAEKLAAFLDFYDTAEGRVLLAELGIRAFEIEAYLFRGRSLQTAGFPPAYSVGDPEYATYVSDTRRLTRYFERNPPLARS